MPGTRASGRPTAILCSAATFVGAEHERKFIEGLALVINAIYLD
jgi:hypothetical protein